jgi:hypothetical protein
MARHAKWEEILAREKDVRDVGAEGLEILENAKAHIASVPYRATLRFIFYRLWDAAQIPLESYTGKKGKPFCEPKWRAYQKVKGLLSDARYLGLLERDALADDTREPTMPRTFASTETWLRAVGNVECRLDPWHEHETRVLFLYEAEAMSAQFEYHAGPYRVELWPFRGDPSIPYKWSLAQRVRSLADGQDVVLLYAGDRDDKGEEICRNNIGYVLTWADCENVRAYRVGLTQKQGKHYGLTDNPEKPGTYQWESLPDDAAGELITGALDEYAPDLDAVTELEKKTTARFAMAIEKLRATHEGSA